MKKSEPTLLYLDTSITVKAASEINNRNISQNEAERYLYKHFKKIGVINRSNYKADSLIYREIMCVQYDTSYSIKTNTFSGSIICYWLGVCDLNGHCFQPSKAIIVRTKNGFNISDENFIPTNFGIDSIRKEFIYGYDYECGGRGVVGQFRVQLK